MIRHRIFCLLLLFVQVAHVFTDTQVTEEKTANSANNFVLKKSLPNSHADDLIHTLTNWLYPSKDVNNWEDLSTSASEYKGEKYLPPSLNFRGRGRSCYDCNSEPWIPIAGRSLHFPSLPSSHSNSLEYNNQPYFKEKGSTQFSLFRPPSDQYGAPQGKFNYPATGEVVDFMLPPPYKMAAVGNAYLPPIYLPPKPTIAVQDTNIFNLSPPPLLEVAPSWSSYGAPPRGAPPPKYLKPYPTTPLRPVSQSFQPPPLIGIHNLPLENNLPPAMPSDSYGRPITSSHAEPITSSSEFTRVGPFGQDKFVRNHQNDFTSNVQVLPSVKIADYTASIEHPINLIQSPIFDLNVEGQRPAGELGITGGSLNNKETSDKLSDNPIVVDDSYTSSSNINTTYSSSESQATLKRHNDKYLDSGEFKNHNELSGVDLSDKLIQKFLLEHNVIDDPGNQIVGIHKSVVDPRKIKTRLNLVSSSLDYSSWGGAKNPKKLQIIVPYVKAPQSTAIYNREYTTLAPVFVPPPVTSEATTLWTQLVQDIRTVENRMKPAQGFVTSTTTEAYNINDFIAEKQIPSYDINSLQKNIDDWTHQAYSNHHSLTGQFTTKLKRIPEEYLSTTPIYSDIAQGFTDPESANSDKKEVVIEAIETNSILPDRQTSSEDANTEHKAGLEVRKSSWESNKVTLSNSTHEKVYVVTPQSYHIFPTSSPATAFSMAPKIENGQVNNASTMTRISVRIERPEDGGDKISKPLKVVYSEWPHLINDLETTTTSKPTTRHPLFGLMDLAPYTMPSSPMVETIGGHSKVTSVGTSPLIKFTSTTPTPFEKANGTFSQTVLRSSTIFQLFRCASDLSVTICLYNFYEAKVKQINSCPVERLQTRDHSNNPRYCRTLFNKTIYIK